jgi:ABC-type glycerol-3-phosphate transport system permease component
MELTRSQSRNRSWRNMLPSIWTGSNRRAAIVSLVLTPICLVWIYPFLWMVSASFKTNAEFFQGTGLIPTSPQWNNYVRAWQNAHIGDYFFNSVIVTVSAVAIATITGAMIGYVLGRYSFPGKKVLMGLFVATVFIPQGYTVIPVFEIVNRLGLAETLWGVILAEAGGVNVLSILLFAGYFAQLPRELEEAAQMDGAGFLRVFWSIMLPLSKPVIASTIILRFITIWNSFLLPLVLTLSRPALRTLAVGIYAFRGEYYVDWGGMAAAATISLLPVIIMFILLQRYFVEGISGAVKQ